jgi:hypothetical protein
MTGMVSTQFHLRYDDTFETIRGVREASHGIWCMKCYFSDPPSQDTGTKRLFKAKEKEKTEQAEELEQQQDNDHNIQCTEAKIEPMSQNEYLQQIINKMDQQ